LQAAERRKGMKLFLALAAVLFPLIALIIAHCDRKEIEKDNTRSLAVLMVAFAFSLVIAGFIWGGTELLKIFFSQT
jgi:hypothetical protein